MTSPILFRVKANYSSFSTQTVSGKVSFRAVVNQGDVVAGLGFTIPEGFLNGWIDGHIINGVLCAADGTPGVPLLANSGLGLTSGLFYRVRYSDLQGYDPPKDLVIAAPTDSSDLPLLAVTPAPGTTAVALVTLPSAQIADATAIGRQVLTATDATAVKGLLGISGGNDWEEFANLAAFPATGNSALEYLAMDTGKLYRWTGAAYSVLPVTWTDIGGRPAVIAAGADAAAARAAIGVVPGAPVRNTAVAIGDSITAANSTGYIGLQGDMWFNHLCIDTEQRIQYAGYFATPGFTLANIQTTHLPTVLAMNPLPGACAVFGGTNDMSAWGTGGASFAASKTTLKAIVASLLAVGVVPMLCTIPPITNSTDAVNQNTVTWNMWVRRYAAANGFPLIDANAALLGADGHYASGLDSGDGVHPNQKGHRAIAQRAIDDEVFESFPPARPRTSRSSADLSNMFGSGTASYGLFLTNTAGVGTGLTASGTGYTASIVAPTAADDLQGNWQQLSRTTGNTGTATLTATSMTGGWSVGDVLAFSFRVQAEQLFESATTFYVMLWNGAPTNSHAGLYLFESDVDGLFYVEIPLPTGAAFAYWELQMSAVGGTGNPTVRVGEVTVRNLTTGGILT